MHAETDVLVIGSGAAGMYAAIEAARAGCDVLLLDRSLIGRGGATVMAQMTVAVALGSGDPDHWTYHLNDTMRRPRALQRAAGTAPVRGRIGVHHGDGSLGRRLGPPRRPHRPGPGTGTRSGALRLRGFPQHRPGGFEDAANHRQSHHRHPQGRRPVRGRSLARRCEIIGAVALHLGSGAAVVISAKATIVATGGLTRLYARNSASANMGGDGYALALRAGASLVDMEFVQFFPIGHLAPRLIGMDPIMWDPFRYKLGGRLLNGRMKEFTSQYGSDEDGKYVLTRDLASYAILKEVEAGRGSPHGGAYLSFQHCSEAALREAFGPVIDRLANNNIDLTRTPIEVAPIAHYHMGGVRADARMATELPGLFVAGEAVGGANGANRLSGNAITEALVFGRRAGRSSAMHARSIKTQQDGQPAARATLDLITAERGRDINTAEMIAAVQATMQRDVGTLRREDKLVRAQTRLAQLASDLGECPPSGPTVFDLQRLEWFDLRNMLLVARTVAQTALARRESRGAHQREDFPDTKPAWELTQVAALRDERIILSGSHGSALEAAQ